MGCFQKSAFYSGIRIFNSLPHSLTNLKNEKAQFKVALRRYLNAHSFLSLFKVWNILQMVCWEEMNTCWYNRIYCLAFIHMKHTVNETINMPYSWSYCFTHIFKWQWVNMKCTQIFKWKWVNTKCTRRKMKDKGVLSLLPFGLYIKVWMVVLNQTSFSLRY
jgi:hypothetical protein